MFCAAKKRKFPLYHPLIMLVRTEFLFLVPCHQVPMQAVDCPQETIMELMRIGLPVCMHPLESSNDRSSEEES